MLTFEDCLRVCRLTEAEIDAIAEHEHLPAIVALELANCLMQTPDGRRRIQSMIFDDIAAAESHGNAARAMLLRSTLQRFVDTYPELPRSRIRTKPTAKIKLQRRPPPPLASKAVRRTQARPTA